jgi:hypothetical protein
MGKMKESKVKRKKEIIPGAKKWPYGATCQTTTLKIMALGISWPP